MFQDRTAAAVLWNLIPCKRHFPNQREQAEERNYCRWVLEQRIRLLMVQTAPARPRSHTLPDPAGNWEG